MSGGAARPIVYAQSVDSLTWEGDLPHLRSPVLVCAFRGWNDAAAAASTALGAVASSFDSELIAKVDPEDYFDFQSTRPTISMVDGEIDVSFFYPAYAVPAGVRVEPLARVAAHLMIDIGSPLAAERASRFAAVFSQ